jgi:hypothetical protein
MTVYVCWIKNSNPVAVYFLKKDADAFCVENPECRWVELYLQTE